MKKSIKIILWVVVISTIMGAIGALFSKNEPKEARCDFKKATLKLMEWGSEKVISEQTFDGAFIKKEVDNFGLQEISATNSNFKVLFYDESPMKFLNVRIGEDDPTEWRKNKGHDIYKVEKDNKLNFIFGDKEKIKGTIVFE